MNKIVEDLVLEFSKLEEIEGILLGGSQATNTTDSASDYDLYFYYSKEVPIEKRRSHSPTSRALWIHSQRSILSI